jgi:enhancing lycopene biosynthesis protein 2
MREKPPEWTAIFLAGCGYEQGTDLWEVAFLSYHLERCHRPITNISANPSAKPAGRELDSPPNPLEASRLLCRGELFALQEVEDRSFWSLILPGGKGGLAYFSDFETKGENFKVDLNLRGLVRKMYRRRRPIAACGLGVVFLVSCLKKLAAPPPTVTVGGDAQISHLLEKLGAQVIPTTSGEALMDHENLLVTTGGALVEKRFMKLSEGMENIVRGLVELSKLPGEPHERIAG